MASAAGHGLLVVSSNLTPPWKTIFNEERMFSCKIWKILLDPHEYGHTRPPRPSQFRWCISEATIFVVCTYTHPPGFKEKFGSEIRLRGWVILSPYHPSACYTLCWHQATRGINLETLVRYPSLTSSYVQEHFELVTLYEYVHGRRVLVSS